MKSITVPPLCWSSIDCPEPCAERIGVICLYIHEKKIIQKLKVLRPPSLFSFPFTLSLLPFTKKVKQCNPTANLICRASLSLLTAGEEIKKSITCL